MEAFPFLRDIIGFQNTPLLMLLLKGVLVYIAFLWLAVIVWVARDVIDRSKSLIFQVIMILLNIFLPVFGLLLYLIIRPSKTLLERYYEELEYKVFSESQDDKEHCVRCDEILKPEFIFCPRCEEKVKNLCPHCKHSFGGEFKICPFCGRKPKDFKKKKEIIA